MSEKMDDAIDRLLREQFEGPVPVDGFCDRVMDRLPVRRHRTIWPLVVGMVAGVGMCWLSLRAAPITQAGWDDWVSGELSASAVALFIAMATMTILAAAWSIAESDDRYASSSKLGAC